MVIYKLHKRSLINSTIGIFFLLAIVKTSLASNTRTLKDLQDPNYQIQQLIKQGHIVDGTPLIQSMLDELIGPDYDKKCKEREEKLKKLTKERIEQDPIIQEWEEQKQKVKAQMPIQLRQQRLRKFDPDTTSTTEIGKGGIGSLPSIETIDGAIETRKRKIREEVEKSEPKIEKGGMRGLVRAAKKASEARMKRLEKEGKEKEGKEKLKRLIEEKRKAEQKNSSDLMPIIAGVTTILSCLTGLYYYGYKNYFSSK